MTVDNVNDNIRFVICYGSGRWNVKIDIRNKKSYLRIGEAKYWSCQCFLDQKRGEVEFRGWQRRVLTERTEVGSSEGMVASSVRGFVCWCGRR